MRLISTLSFAVLLSACGPQKTETTDTETPDTARQATGDTRVADGQTAALKPCDAVRAIASGMNPQAPFEGLSHEAGADAPFPDQLVTDLKPFGTVCSHGVLQGWDEGDPDSHVFRCRVFEASSMQFEEQKPNAEAAFEDAKATLDKCLPEGWTARLDDGQQQGQEAVTYIYERPSDIERRENSDFYMYPIMLRKAFFQSPESRGGPWGWIVDVAFQQEEAAKAADRAN